jgi:multiple sugar transport system substrate-binding protein
MQAVTLLNGQTNERSIYAIPVAQQIEHIHVWKSMIEETGLSLDDVPGTWNEWWDWWCETAQPAVREATGDRQKYGVGQPMSSAASDTVFAYMMFLNAFDTKLVDDEGNLLVDQPETREGMIKALESYTKPYLEGCVPPGAVNWQDGDNNVNFKNQISFMVPNPSLSIPASEYAEKDRYMNQMVTMEWPDKPDGSPIEYVPRSRPR